MKSALVRRKQPSALGSRKKAVAQALVFILGAAFALLLSPSSPGAERENKSSRVLHALFATEWDYTLEQNPTMASQLGDRRWNDRWEDVSLAAIQRQHEHARDVLSRLKKIDRRKLSRADQLNGDLFQKEYETSIEEHQFRWYLVPLNQREGIQTADELADALRFGTVKDYEDWVARLRAFPAYLDQTITLMREGIHARILQPKVTMQRVPAQIDKQIVETPEKSPFYKPFQDFPGSIPQAERARLQDAGKQAISARVIPAYRRLKEFFVGEYLPACFDQVGAWQMPNGEAMYAFFTRKFTTTRLTPREIHDIGQREVKRIRAEMNAVMDEVGFKGSLPEFFQFLRTDPQFYCKTPEELLMTCRAVAKRIDPRLVKIFRTIPRTPYGVEPIPDKIAPDTTTAYYRQPAADGSRAGTYFVNLYKPEPRPKWEMMALSLHEAVPGHHLQIALAQELGELPNFRRYGGYTVYVEGWGLYAESLGEDMGLYDDPYSKFGQLTYEMWRAVRLVVDTGIHHLKWDRQKAIDFFLENAAKSELDVVNEIDRYISWPGQALAYKIGELKIKELRARASRALGDRFDLREFHDIVLKQGAVPLDILERTADEWIATKKKL
jgi:uncharacterized protein (DUF885 family)